MANYEAAVRDINVAGTGYYIPDANFITMGCDGLKTYRDALIAQIAMWRERHANGSKKERPNIDKVIAVQSGKLTVYEQLLVQCNQVLPPPVDPAPVVVGSGSVDNPGDILPGGVTGTDDKTMTNNNTTTTTTNNTQVTPAASVDTKKYLKTALIGVGILVAIVVIVVVVRKKRSKTS